MKDLIDAGNKFYLGVNDPVTMFEKRSQAPAVDVTVLINRRGENSAAVLLIPVGVIRSPAEE
jgi:hypothetical protein